MRSAGQFAAHLLEAKPAGQALSTFALSGLPEPAFGNALLSDAASLAFASLVSMGEALSGIRGQQYAWSVVKLYYCCFYALKAHLAIDGVVVFHCRKREYVCDTVDGYTQEFGRSSHQFAWTKISNIRLLSNWVYSDVAGEAFGRIRLMRENASYKLAFPDPSPPAEIGSAVPSSLEKAYRTYKADDDLFYTFLQEHVVLALPTKMCLEAARRLQTAGHSFTADQRRHLNRVWPFREAGLW